MTTTPTELELMQVSPSPALRGAAAEVVGLLHEVNSRISLYGDKVISETARDRVTKTWRSNRDVVEKQMMAFARLKASEELKPEGLKSHAVQLMPVIDKVFSDETAAIGGLRKSIEQMEDAAVRGMVPTVFAADGTVIGYEAPKEPTLHELLQRFEVQRLLREKNQGEIDSMYMAAIESGNQLLIAAVDAAPQGFELVSQDPEVQQKIRELKIKHSPLAARIAEVKKEVDARSYMLAGFQSSIDSSTLGRLVRAASRVA